MIPFSQIKTPLPKCPICGSDNVLPIMYGLPDNEMSELVHSGKIILGGCVFDFYSNTHGCTDCQTEFIDPAAKIERTKLMLPMFDKDNKLDKAITIEMEQLIAEYEAKLDSLTSQ